MYQINVDKWIEEIDKVINEQTKIFDKYEKVILENKEWVDYFQKMKYEFIEEMEKEKTRIKKQHGEK
jgi:preprotein translocase subunit SecA